MKHHLYEVQDLLTHSIITNEYGDIRTILDEYMPQPTWSELMSMSTYLTKHVRGALFDYDVKDGWGYTEEGE